MRAHPVVLAVEAGDDLDGDPSATWLRIEIRVPSVGGGLRSTTFTRMSLMRTGSVRLSPLEFSTLPRADLGGQGLHLLVGQPLRELPDPAVGSVGGDAPDVSTSSAGPLSFASSQELSMGRAKTATTTTMIARSPAVPPRPSHSFGSGPFRPRTPPGVADRPALRLPATTRRLATDATSGFARGTAAVKMSEARTRAGRERNRYPRTDQSPGRV
ncbi:hypothetical protein [Saccharopolyspora endophytica]|uniref:Uncharacterized protein n=1 Tax=Saccharopolyspora endophytica TaxID=543886 RepID=A0ABS5DF72_9PSEU|nr:hypothetical protein [Saccharopolyspora endophytica]MBQ0924929.1 hypothetical protein [Saccharopolyspora endophytica]